MLVGLGFHFGGTMMKLGEKGGGKNLGGSGGGETRSKYDKCFKNEKERATRGDAYDRNSLYVHEKVTMEPLLCIINMY